MAEYVCELPVEGMASFMSGGELIPVHERIVRCGDCKHYHASIHGCDEFGDEWRNEYANVEPDGFCMWGERKVMDA